MDEQKEIAFKFGAEEDRLFDLLDPSVCEYMEQGNPFTLEETAADGQARIKVHTERPCFVVRCMDDKRKGHIRSLPFFRQSGKKEVTQCADHVIFQFHNGNWTLHILEFKSSIGPYEWRSVLRQLNGAMIRAYAIAGVLRITEFAEVFLCCAYKNADAEDKSNPSMVKTSSIRVPVEDRIRNSEDFRKDKFSLISYPKRRTKNRLVKLDDNGYAEIRL